MRFLLGVIRWLYQVFAGVAVLITACLLSSVAWEFPLQRSQLVPGSLEPWGSDPRVRLGLGLAAVAMVFGMLIYAWSNSRMRRQVPSLAFDNPDGEVSISIAAIEDFVRRIGKDFEEVKSLEPTVLSRRDGVEISLKVELWSEPNIPKLTERVQNVVKSQVQNILGIENVRKVTLSVGKIITRDKDYQLPSQSDIFADGGSAAEGQGAATSAPYHGSGADY